MDPLMLDTDVFSFFFKKDTRRELYVEDIKDRQLCLSFMSVAELKRWAIERSWGQKRRDRLDQTLKRYVVLPYDALMAEAWAQITADRNRIGLPIACGDCWIAAAAVRHGIPLATHNEKHYRDIANLELITHAPT